MWYECQSSFPVKNRCQLYHVYHKKFIKIHWKLTAHHYGLKGNDKKRQTTIKKIHYTKNKGLRNKNPPRNHRWTHMLWKYQHSCSTSGTSWLFIWDIPKWHDEGKEEVIVVRNTGSLIYHMYICSFKYFRYCR